MQSMGKDLSSFLSCNCWGRMTKINCRLLSGASLAALLLSDPSAARTAQARVESDDVPRNFPFANMSVIEAHGAVNPHVAPFGRGGANSITADERSVGEIASLNNDGIAGRLTLPAAAIATNVDLYVRETAHPSVTEGCLPLALATHVLINSSTMHDQVSVTVSAGHSAVADVCCADQASCHSNGNSLPTSSSTHPRARLRPLSRPMRAQ